MSRWSYFTKKWILSQPGIYPLYALMGGAVVLAAHESLRKLIYHPDVKLSRDRRRSETIQPHRVGEGDFLYGFEKKLVKRPN
jgi:hypothetical protein